MNSYESSGRKVLIQFTCGRCGKTHIEPFAKQTESAEENLQCFRPPEGWQNDGIYMPLLCDECAREFAEFIRGNKNE